MEKDPTNAIDADFLFFDDEEDAKKTENNVLKVKGCLIHVHEDIKNLPPFPSTFLQYCIESLAVR